MESYSQFIRDNAIHHRFSEDGYDQWPATVLNCVKGLQVQDTLKLPVWVKSGPYPHVDQGILPLLSELATSKYESWSSDQEHDSELQKRFWHTFGTVLSNCATIHNVLDAEAEEDRPYPKESFLVVLVRNVLLRTHPEVVPRENVLVSLPLGSSGERSPLLHYMPNWFCAPLVVTVSETAPCVHQDDEGSGTGEQDTHPHDKHGNNSRSTSVPLRDNSSTTRSTDDNQNKDSNSDNDESYTRSSEDEDSFRGPTASEFIRNMMKPRTVKDEEDEVEDVVMPPEFNYHFRAYQPSSALPSVCQIAVFCMAEHEQLPLLMTSLLYQRRVWHIDEPLFGLGFSKYDTVVKLYVGWLDDHISSGCVLPRIHIGEIETEVVLELSTPLIALSLSRLLLNLETYISVAQDSAKRIACTPITKTPSDYFLSWRIDTCILPEHPVLSYWDSVTQWVEKQAREGQLEDNQPEENQLLNEPPFPLDVTGVHPLTIQSQQSYSAYARPIPSL